MDKSAGVKVTTETGSNVAVQCFGARQSLLSFTKSGDTFVASANPDDVRPSVDSIVFYDDDAQPLFVLPLFGQLTHLRLANNGKRIEIRGATRCFLSSESAQQAVAFEIEIEFDKPSGITRPLLWNQFSIAGDSKSNVAFATTKDMTWSFASDGRLPLLATIAGLEAGFNTDKEIIAAFAALEKNAPALVFQFRASRLVGNDSRLPWFGLNARSNAPIELLQSVMRSVGDTPPEHPWVLVVPVRHEQAIDAWNGEIATPYIDSLHTVRDGRPLSLLPRFTKTAPNAKEWRARFAIVDQSAKARLTRDDVVVRGPHQQTTPLKVTFVPHSLEPSETVEEEATMAAFVTRTIEGVEPKPLRAMTRLTRLGGFVDQVPLLGKKVGFAFGIEHVAGSETENQIVRMGALDLTFPPAGRVASAASFRAGLTEVSAGLRTVIRSKGDDLPGRVQVPELGMRLAVLAVRPGNQDDVTGDEFVAEQEALSLDDREYESFFRRTPSLVIALDTPQTPNEPTLVLDVAEAAFEQNSQTISIRLRKGGVAGISGDSQKAGIVVLDSQPFLVAKVELDDFESSLRDAVTDEIANWSNRADERGGWELSGGATGFRLQLPPQGMGESMERRRGDIPPSIDDKVENRIDFRFTPPARFSLQSSFFRQRFAEAPWNLRRVLGFPGQRAPGAGVDDMQFELLYGLSVRVRNRRLRLAEIASRLGAEPGRQRPNLPWRANGDQERTYVRYRLLWRQIFASLRSRLAILEPWDTHQDGPLELNETSGVTCELRRSAKLRYPVDVSPDRVPLQIPNDPKGLTGGIAWGFESANVYNAVWRDPKSSSAQLMRPYFSALGGWGYQKASFDRNLSSLYSDTAMGRTFMISIERIGRISVTWNRAKHVIVYERSVRPSRQFYQEQDELEGIPVLRKVREYVEILEEERRFTDAPQERGFVTACIFPASSKRINVNSRWGGDIGTTGWKVPLWVRNANPQDVYPKPLIFLEAVGESADKPSQQINDEPEKLFFYTNTDANQPPDPNLWPPVEDVDFARVLRDDVEAPQENFGKGKPKDSPVTDKLVKDTLEPFTFRLAPSSSPVNVVAERSPEAISAILHNITLMRGPVAPFDERAEGAFAVRALRSVVRRSIDQVLETLPGTIDANALTNVCAMMTTALNDVQKRWDTLAKVPDVDARFREEIHRRVETTFSNAERQIQSQLLARLTDQWSTARAEIETLKVQGDAAYASLMETTKERIVLGALAARRSTRSVAGSVGELLDVADVAKQEIVAAVDGAIAGLRQTAEEIKALDPSKFEPVIDRARRVVAEKIRSVDFALSQVPRRIVGNRLDGLRIALADLSTAIDAKARDLRHLVRKGSVTLGEVLVIIADLEEMLAQLGEQAAYAIDILADEVEDAVGDGEVALLTSIDQLERDALQLVDDAVAAPKPWDKLLETLDKRGTGWSESLEELVARHIAAVKGELSKQIDTLLTNALPLLTPERLAQLEDETLGRIRAEKEALCTLLCNILPTPELLREELERLFERLLHHIEEIAERALATLPAVNLSQLNPDSLLRLVRAYGAPPKVPNLAFRLPQTDLDGIGYYFRDFLGKIPLPDVKLTPIIARVNDVLDDLKELNPIHIELPTFSLTDRIKPAELTNFDLASIFPDFGGIKLDGLFSNLRLPAIANDAVRVTHGFDAQTMSGWIQAEVDVPFGEPTTVFSISGITLRLNRARFVATIRIESAGGQSPRRSFRGMISGDWDLQVGGFPIAVLVDTSLTFDDSGRIHFDVSPDRVRLQAVLAFLSDLISGIGYSDSGFSVKLLPTGVESVLDLPLPDVQAGTFGLANLHLGFAFRLAFEGGAFVVGTKFFIGSKRAPFTITVFILGGAGWIDVGFRYFPATGVFTTSVSIAIMASAGLAIAFGPIKGGVFAYFGINVNYESSSTGQSNLTIGLLLLFRGEVSLLGFLSVCLSVALEALYSPGGGLIGRGSVSYSIKICWCVTINVSVGIEYRFASGTSSSTRSLAAPLAAMLAAPAPIAATYEQRAAAYLEMFA